MKVPSSSCFSGPALYAVGPQITEINTVAFAIGFQEDDRNQCEDDARDTIEEALKFKRNHLFEVHEAVTLVESNERRQERDERSLFIEGFPKNTKTHRTLSNANFGGKNLTSVDCGLLWIKVFQSPCTESGSTKKMTFAPKVDQSDDDEDEEMESSDEGIEEIV
ncbi:unnamed protein product [Heligmosomoides polygyrus]|uniref:Uncharacterized protein n=1 Tax=Heligmosomoides polygyrus TaxID=6339 RepID=A0A183FIF4_HELPZ|nr:unnamed protein product [Heligmosomoides polygyrus]